MGGIDEQCIPCRNATRDSLQGRCLKAKAVLQWHLWWQFCRVPVLKFVFAVIGERWPPQSRRCCGSQDLAVTNTGYCPQAHASALGKGDAG